MGAMTEETEYTDAEVWAMELGAYSPADLIIRKMRLVAEASDYVLKQVKRAKRRIAKIQRHIDAYLEAQ